MLTLSNLDWWPHIAVIAWHDGEKIVARAALCIFRKPFYFGRQANLWVK